MKRMSGVDAAFLYGETPAWHMHVSAVLLTDPSETPGGFSAERFEQRIASRLHLVPQFRWKLVEVPLGLDRPGWVEDPNFDISYHVRHIGVPPPGGPEQLGNLIGDLVGYKLNRNIPLWEMWVMDGLADGNVAILAKVHHSIIDGVSGSELATVLFDLEPDPDDEDEDEIAAHHEIGPVPSSAELVARGVGRMMMSPYRFARFTDQTVRQGLKFIGFQRRAKPPSIPFQAPRTSFNAELTPHRRFAYTSVSLDEVREIKDAFGVKVNDVVLALCAGTLRRYLEKGDELPSTPLIAQVPISLRTDADHGEVGTKVGAMFASLATDIDDPVARLGAIHESTQGAKEMQQALAADKIMGLTELTSPGLISLAARMYTSAGLSSLTPPIMNLIISNVPGPPFPIYTAGARVEALYTMGPLLYGTGINITVFSYDGRIDFGFMVCRELVADPWSLPEGIPIALSELLTAARARTAAGTGDET
ncbi:MAG: WS/DGAT/MGAT family O-acyltransferase [Acidimicrobiales bacterium]